MFLNFPKENLSACGKFCEDNFSKKRHDTTEELGAWFCRGQWLHKNRGVTKEWGGCSYWTGEGALSLHACKKEYSDSEFGTHGRWITGTKDYIDEIDMCKKGCEIGGNQNSIRRNFYCSTFT